MQIRKKRIKPAPRYKSPSRPLQTVLDLFGKMYRKRKAVNISIPMKPKPEPYQYPTAQKLTPAGKKFIETFQTRTTIKRRKHFTVEIVSDRHATVESKNALVLIDKKSSTPNGSIIARIGIGFEENAIVMEVVQGRKKGEKQRQEYISLTKENWTTGMIKMIEEHARNCGVRFAKIRRPETLYAYQLQGKEVQEQIRTLYHSIASAMGYKPKGAFFVKQL